MQLRVIETGTEHYEAMVALRMKVLLDPIGIPKSYINSEKEKSDLLIGAFEGQKLIGCCILTEIGKTTIQLRQMAVDTDHRKKGVGAAILAFAEKLAIEKGYRHLIMHARDNVLNFYKKNGYQISGDQFTEVNIAHHKMQKKLQ